jgi:tetratricopeptide (TPR) repeat protein
MILDNADVLSPAALEAYFPPGMRGNILITSRNSVMMTLTSPENSLEVTEMEERDAVGLLLKASCLKSPISDVQIQASKIVKELFCFPLAIDQAGAYIASGATTIGDYLAKYSEHRKTLLYHCEFTGASKYNRTVFETWELSYKEIQQRAKSDDFHKANAANSAMLLLGLFPFFHHEGITEEIFSYAALPEDDETLMSNLPLASALLDQRLLPLCETGTWDNFIFREGIRILLSFSLIRRGPSDNVYAMHPLVHTWCRDRLTLNEREKCCLMAYVTLSCSLRWDGAQPYGFHRTLVTHVRANMEYLKSECNQNIVSYMDDAYEKFGRLLREQGYSKEAQTLQIKVLDERNKIYGVEHPDTINAMASLASTNGDLEKYMEAEMLKIQVLEARKRILGVEHPDTILAMGNLATTYHSLKKYTEAEKLEIQVLDASSKILGVEHPATIFVMGNLAMTYRSLGKYTESEKLGIQILESRTRILGVEHPDTIRAMANLAVTYGSLGKYKEAEKLEIQVLDASNKIIGVEHPDTIRAMANLASTYRNLGKYKEAEKLEAQVLDTRNRTLGVEHPETIRAMANLAVTYKKLGKYREAEKMEIQVLDARNRILGVEHSETINAMGKLATTYYSLGKYTEAEKLDIQVLDARKRVLGVQHPHTILAMENLAATLKSLGKYKEAEKLFIQAQAVNNRGLGVEYHYTIATVANVHEAHEI